MRLSKIYYSLFVGVVLTSCSTPSPTTTTATEIAPAKDEIIVTQQQFEWAGMQTGQLQQREFTQTISCIGKVDVPPERRVAVSAYFGGYVKVLSLLPGQFVQKGEVLFVLENPDFVNVQEQFLEAQSQAAYLKSDYERQKRLWEEKVNSEKTFLKAEADYQVNEAKLAALKGKLSLMNMNPSSVSVEQLKSSIAIYAPSDGYITSVNVVRGKYLNPEDIAVTIVNTEHLHLELEVYEQDLAKIKIGQKVNFTLANDSEEFEAVVHLINRVVDEEKRTVQVHAHLAENVDPQNIYPGMYVEAEIVTTAEAQWALPEEAISNTESQSFVLTVKKHEADAWVLEKHEVKATAPANGWVALRNIDALSTSSQFITKGVYGLISVE